MTRSLPRPAVPALALALPLLFDSAIAHGATQLSTVQQGLDRPVFVTHAGDARLFIVEQPGRIRVLDQPTPAGTLSTFLDLRSLVVSDGERGLLSMAFHPDYQENGYFYVNYTNLSGSTVIARYAVSGNPNVANPSSGVTLMTIAQPFTNHKGGQLQIGPLDGYLYIGMGDGGGAGDPGCRAQRTDGGQLLGKMLRVDVRQNLTTAPYYGIPAANPFTAAQDPTNAVADEIWALGLRNPWRFSFDRSNGDMYIADVGQSEREEIDYEPAGFEGGANYGWKPMEGSLCFSNSGCPVGTPTCNDASLTLPIFEYDHAEGCSITGGYVYRGPNAPELFGAYLFADWCSGEVQTLRRENGNWVREIVATADTPTSFGENDVGRVFITAGNDLLEVTSDPVAAPLLARNGAAAFAAALLGIGLSIRRKRAGRAFPSGSSSPSPAGPNP